MQTVPVLCLFQIQFSLKDVLSLPASQRSPICMASQSPHANEVLFLSLTAAVGMCWYCSRSDSLVTCITQRVQQRRANPFCLKLFGVPESLESVEAGCLQINRGLLPLPSWFSCCSSGKPTYATLWKVR